MARNTIESLFVKRYSRKGRHQVYVHWKIVNEAIEYVVIPTALSEGFLLQN